MSKEFYLGNFDKEELKRLIQEATNKLTEIENEEKFQYKPLLKTNTTYVSKTNLGYVLHRVCTVRPDRLDVNYYDSLYISANNITYEEEETIMNKDVDELILNGKWKEVDNSIYDEVFKQWEKMNDEVISVEATYGSNALTKLNEL
jgi:hypothetical protein